jgi:hypothetical protein
MDLRHEGLKMAAGLWYQVDPDRAYTWLWNLPFQSEDGDSALEGYILQLAARDRQAAFERAARIYNEELRQKVISQLKSMPEGGTLH